jgi:endogenous inhibitor of DNA gyrase (YacG/DUF329 family)
MSVWFPVPLWVGVIALCVIVLVGLARRSGLRNCPECDEKISRRARRCPHCGQVVAPLEASPSRPITIPGRTIFVILAFIFAVAVAIAILTALRDPYHRWG